jgi:hypothetical protein
MKRINSLKSSNIKDAMTSLGGSSGLGSMLTLIFFAVVVQQLIVLVTNYLLSSDNVNVFLIYFGMLGSYLVIIPAFFLFLLRPSFKVNKNGMKISKSIMLFTVLAIGYFGLWLVLGLALGQHPKDVVGSTGRVFLPFLMYVFVSSGLSFVMPVVRMKFYKFIFLSLFLFTIAGAVGKILLMIQGMFYGGGLNQFKIPVVILSWMILLLSNKVLSQKKQILVLGGLLIFVFLSVLSFKRGVWLELCVSLLIIFFMISHRNRMKIIFMSVIFLFIIVLSLVQIGQADKIISRLQSTFSGGNSGIEALDSSSYYRIMELQAASYTLNKTKLTWLTGLGPGAGYENPYNYRFVNFNEYGEPYHIHSALGIIIFRYGLIGALFHLSLVALCIRWLFLFSRRLKSERISSPWHPYIIGFSASMANVASITSLITSNVYFGSFMFGLMFAIAMQCRLYLLGQSKQRRTC